MKRAGFSYRSFKREGKGKTDWGFEKGLESERRKAIEGLGKRV